MEKKRIGLIVCEIFFREVAYFAARSPHTVDVVYMPKGLHDLGGEKMREYIQAEIDKMNEKDYSHILLYYALCNNGTAGLTTEKCPVIIPRAHDCITLFLGSRQRYEKVFYDDKGSYFHTTGWIERGAGQEQFFDSELGSPELSLQEYIDKYGEENGRYIWETMNPSHYGNILYIDMPIPDLPDMREQSKEIAKEKGWEWKEVKGDATLIQQMLNGPHSEDDFLTLKPGYKTFPTNDERILDVMPVEG